MCRTKFFWRINVSGKFYRNKLSQILQYFFQFFLVLLLLVLMVTWGLLLADITQNGNFARNSLVSNTFNSNLSDISPKDPAGTFVLAITNIAIPELFVLIALLAVILKDIYWCAISGLILFVFWILNHQRYPNMFGWNTSNSLQVLVLVAHSCHLIAWTLLLIYGGLVAMQWRIHYNNNIKLIQAHFFQSPMISLPSPPQFNTYCGYLSPSQLTTNRTHLTMDAPPCYDISLPPQSTLQTTQICSTNQYQLWTVSIVNWESM